MEIEIFADVVCPWCYIGKRRLDQALAVFDAEVTVRFRAFQLDPDAPHECQPVRSYLADRFGGADLAERITAHVAEIAAADGITMNFDRARISNTINAHRLLAFAGTEEAVAFGATADTQPQLAEVLHRMHFTHGFDIGAADVLTAAAVEVGLDGARVAKLLTSTDYTAEVKGDMAAAQELGITTVPTFVLNGAYSITGAQEPGTLLEVLRKVQRRNPVRVPAPRDGSHDSGPHECADEACTAV